MNSSRLLLSTLPPEALETVHGGQGPGAQFNCADSDGHVPETYGNFGQGWLAATFYDSLNPCQRSIKYDTYNMRNAGPNDWANVRAHERAHAAGWNHGQGSPAANAAFSPSYRITGK